jgi:hypothetical protein
MEMKPLNIFQRVIRVWEEAHPYNAAQILHVAGKPDIQKLTDAWNETLAASGLGVAHVAGKRFRYEKAPRQELLIVDPQKGLDAFITEQMNLPFGDAPIRRDTPFAEIPFRPFVMVQGDTHYMGAIYQHWVADSISLRMLLRGWFCRLHDPANVVAQELHVPTGGLWRYFGPKRTGWSFTRGAVALLRSTAQFKSARRLETDPAEQRVECSLHRLPDGMIDILLAVARAKKSSLNDLFTAALAKACDQHGPEPRKSPRDLALGSIVDLRPASSENLDNTFSLFLGFTSVIVTANDLQNPDQLLASITQQNNLQKNRRAPHASMLRMAVGYTQGRWLSQKRLAAFYRNYMPLFGGISNVNMNRSWPSKYHPEPLLDYIRVAPTGPMVPVVIAVTTLGNRFTFVLTRRASVVDADRGKLLVQTFLDELTAHAKMG